MVIRSPATDEAAAAVETAASVSELRLHTDRQMEATRAAIPEASFTTKVCMEKMTLSSRRLFLTSPYLYRDFSVEKYYGIRIMDRLQVPGMKTMFEPWMIPEELDGEGVQDFKARERVICGTSISDRDIFNTMHMIKMGQIPNF